MEKKREADSAFFANHSSTSNRRYLPELPPSTGVRAQRGILLHWGAYRASRVCLIVRKYAAAMLTFVGGRWGTHGDCAVQIRRGVEKRGQSARVSTVMLGILNRI